MASSSSSSLLLLPRSLLLSGTRSLPRCTCASASALVSAKKQHHLRQRRAFSSTRPAEASQIEAVSPALQTVESSSSASSNAFISTCSEAFLSLPPSSLSYASSIVLLTLFLRASTTLPLTLWQRRRTRRVAQLVVPEVKRWGEQAKYQLRAEFRRAGRGYEEYVTELNTMTKRQFKLLAARYKCRALPTMLVPPAVHLPIFISATLVLRDACIRSLDAAQAGSADLSHAAAGLALESWNWCHSLAENDPYTLLPLAVSVTALTNVEVQFRKRERQNRQMESAMDSPAAAEQVASMSSKAPKNPSRPQLSACRPASVAHPALSSRNKRTYASASSATPTPPPAPAPTAPSPLPPVSMNRSQLAQKILPNALRIVSIIILPVAAYAPVAVNLYWLTTNLFSLTQNLILGRIDKRGTEKPLR